MKDEPVLNAAAWKLIITAVTWLSAKYMPGLHLTDEQAAYLAGGVLSLLTAAWAFVTRKKVAPMTKIEARLKDEHPAALAALKRPS